MQVILSHRFRFLSLLFITLSLFTCNAWSVEMEVPFQYELAWQKTAQAIALEGITLSSSNKDLGIIQGSNPFDENSECFECPELRGAAKEYTFSIVATVTKKTESSSLVSINIEAVRKSYLNKKLLFFNRGKVHSETECKSTGTLEKSIFNTIYEPLASGNPQKRPNDIVATIKSPKNKVSDLNNNITKWAVIIGISSYQFSGNNGLQNLLFADEDAIAFAQTLKKLGWNEDHIKLLVDEKATKRNISIALESWLTKASPEDQIIFFWAGHGFPDPEDPERVYFATYDTEINIPSTGYRMDRVRDALEERKSQNVIVLADTCHAGKIITRGERGISIIPNIKKQPTPKGWIFMVGADTDRQAIEDTSWTNGAFTHSLLKGLNGEADGYQSAGAKDGIVTMGELKDYMNISMPDETQKVLGVAKRPVITTSSGDPGIWSLTLQVKQ